MIPDMAGEDIQAFLAKRQRALAQLDVTALSDLYAEDVVFDSPAGGGTTKGRHAVENIYRSWFEAFPDFKLRDEEYVVEGGQVAHIAKGEGTNAGGFMGLPATGKRFQINLAWIFTIENGKITRERRIYDFTGMLVEIGVLKAKPL